MGTSLQCGDGTHAHSARRPRPDPAQNLPAPLERIVPDMIQLRLGIDPLTYLP